jgi:chemotaxis protein histidine kinase CheA
MAIKKEGGGSSSPKKVDTSDAADVARAKKAAADKAKADKIAADAAAERQRLADAAAAAERQRLADAAAAAERQRLADAAAAEAARVAAEAERQRQVAEAARLAAEAAARAEAARLEAIANAARLAAIAEAAARSLKGSSDFGVVKNPTRDVLNIGSLNPSANAARLQTILWENMSAIELSAVLRHDTVDGIRQRYEIISNLSELRKRYDATKELSVLDKSSLPYSEFTIDLSSKIPDSAYISNNGLDSTYQYVDTDGVSIVEVEKGYIYVANNGDIVIELNNLLSEIAQVQIDSDGTMYEVNN